MVAGLDFDVLRQKETWQAFSVGVVLLCLPSLFLAQNIEV
jgi:uncharacterized integral membrane protein